MIAATNVTPIATPQIYWLAVLPIICVAGAGLAIVMGRALARQQKGVLGISYATAYVGVAGAAISLYAQWKDLNNKHLTSGYIALSRMVVVDKFNIFLAMVVIVSAALALVVASPYLKRVNGPEYLAMVLFAVVGMLAILSANDLIVVFIALEIFSISLYVLTAFTHGRLISQEAGLKYFILGALSSAIFLYGIALVYGATGTTSITGIAQFLSSNYLLESGTLFAGLLLLLTGLGFKISAVPFHMWTPDAYQGAPTPVTAFMAAATKAAAFGALIRIFSIAFSQFSLDWRPVVWVLAVASMVVGSAIALVQTDVKRMLAYSSISHAGFILIGLQANTARGFAASAQYLAIYAVMVIGSFASLYVLSANDEDRMTLSDIRGFGRTKPLIRGNVDVFRACSGRRSVYGRFCRKDLCICCGDCGP